MQCFQVKKVPDLLLTFEYISFQDILRASPYITDAAVSRLDAIAWYTMTDSIVTIILYSWGFEKENFHSCLNFFSSRGPSDYQPVSYDTQSLEPRTGYVRTTRETETCIRLPS